jgi:hypothetical protein
LIELLLRQNVGGIAMGRGPRRGLARCNAATSKASTDGAVRLPARSCVQRYNILYRCQRRATDRQALRG